MSMKKITSKRLILRPMILDDVEYIEQLFNDEKVKRAFGIDGFSREQSEHWLKRNLDHQTQYGYGLFSIILRSTGDWIGDCGLEHGIHDGEDVIEIGYDLLSHYWGHGYATEAAMAVRDAAVHELGIKKSTLCCFIRQGNEASIKVAKKIGMTMKSSFQKAGIEYWLYGYPE